MVSTLREILPYAVRRHGDRTALVVGTDQLTYRQLDEASNAFAARRYREQQRSRRPLPTSSCGLQSPARRAVRGERADHVLGKIMRRLLSDIDDGRVVLEETALTRPG